MRNPLNTDKEGVCEIRQDALIALRTIAAVSGLLGLRALVLGELLEFGRPGQLQCIELHLHAEAKCTSEAAEDEQEACALVAHFQAY